MAVGAKQFLVITALGSNAKSAIFYSRVKGELEDELRRLPCPGGVKIFCPSLLTGARARPRRSEKLAAVVLGAIQPLLPARYRAINAQQVAHATINAAKNP